MDYTIIQDSINNWILSVETQMKQLLSQGGKVATGKLINSIQVIQGGTPDQIQLGLSFTDYGRNVLEGRKPGSKLPPQGSLKSWMSVKGIEPTKEYVIRKAIAVKGIKPFDFVSPFYNAIPQLTDEMAKDFAQLTIETITDNIKNTTVNIG